jgi:hypothetical protein
MFRAPTLAPLLWASLAWGAEPAPDDASAAPASEAAEAEATEAEPTPEAEPAKPEPSAMERLQAQLEALQDQLRAQQEQLDRQARQLQTQGESISDTQVKQARAQEFKVDLTGNYRMRGYVFGAKWGAEKAVTGGLFRDQPTAGKVMDQRLRLGIAFRYKQLASAHLHIQALDDVVAGDNADVASTALFADNPSFTTWDGSETPGFRILRAWTEFRTPIGLLRVGRQTSHWGLGILANSGDGFDDDFGENRYHTSFDRILFGTNPVSIVQAISGKGGKEIPLTLAIAVDRLVEDPLTQYYGYECEGGISQADSPNDYDPRCDVNGDGLTDLEHGYTQDRLATARPQSWWIDQRDDVMEMVYALIYRGEKIRYFGGIGDLTAGGYLIHRTQRETESNVVIADVFLDAKVHGVGVQFEGVGIFGKTRAITLRDSTAEDELYKRASIGGYVARVFYEQPMWKLLMEAGYASGDRQVNNELFTGRALSPDYNAGLLLYEEVIARVTARLWNDDARGLRSKGGVYNSHYIFPRATVSPMNNTKIIAGFLMAWPDQPDGAVIRCTQREVDAGLCSSAAAEKDALGWELDLAIKHEFHKHILVSLETGYAHATDRLPLDVVGLNPNGNFWTFQARAAWQF